MGKINEFIKNTTAKNENFNEANLLNWHLNI